MMKNIGLPLSLQEAGVSKEELKKVLPTLVENVEFDANILQSRRIPDTDEIEQLFWCAFAGTAVDF